MRTKKKFRLFKWFFALLIVALLVFLGADNFGFDWFNFKIDLSQNAQQDIDSDGEKTSEEQGYINIMISDDVILLNEKEVAFEDLEDALKRYPNKNYRINLIDQMALNRVFIQVEGFLRSQNYQMIITESIQ